LKEGFCDFTLAERIDELIYTRWMLSMHVNTWLPGLACKKTRTSNVR